MPAALYGISFKETGNLLAFCSFEKQTLGEAKDADALLKKLIGDKLQIAIGDMGLLEISSSHLAVDLIDAKQDFERVISNVYGYRLKLANNAKPGDATDKDVEAANGKFVSSMVINTSKEVEVKLSKVEGPIGTDVHLVFEGLDPIKTQTTPNIDTVKFALDPSLVLKSTEFYRCLFIKDEVPATLGFLQAP